MTGSLALTVAPLTRGTALSARGVSRRFGGEEVLRHVNLSLPDGELAAVLGAPRSGKSTLLGLLAGLDRPTSGSIELAGVELTGLGDRELARLRRERVGLVLPAVGLIPSLSVLENVLLPLRLARRSPECGLVEDVLHRVGLGDLRSLRPVELSTAERRQVELARALVTEPCVVLADEPSRESIELLQEAAVAYGQATLIATADPERAALASHVHHLEGGAT